ncbi:MAG: hypothetical protein CUN55_00755 [Phototrophicales bacterium]|nr:MAG: hypothetical protein CUN55_00755 [Phototrophicales bacterium]
MSERDRVRLSQLAQEKTTKQTQTESVDISDVDSTHVSAPAQSILSMQRTHGNAAVQRMLGIGHSTYLNGGPIGSELSSMINSKRGSGHSLDSNIQAKAEAAYGYDFSDVSVHTDSESQYLNEALGAEAFTTGKDIFLSQKSINNPETQLHELSHVIQQEGSAPSGELTLGPAEDAYEHEADSMAAQAMSSDTTSVPSAQAMRDSDVQRQAAPEEEEELMAKRDANVQREAMEEEEETLMPKRDADVQREAMEEEEELMAKRDADVQRMEEEELHA